MHPVASSDEMSKLNTPHFPSQQFVQYFEESVYEPAEDSFLLLDALEAELDTFSNKPPLLCLEIGCGSGAITTSLVNALPHTRFIAIDINPRALECTKKCLQLNASERSETVQLVQSDLHSAFGNKLDRIVDLLIFNPPYVPTVQEEIRSGIHATWAGGNDGREIIDRFLQTTLRDTLSEHGQAYMVALAGNKIEEITNLCSDIGFRTETILTRRCGIEKLSILKFVRNTTA